MTESLTREAYVAAWEQERRMDVESIIAHAIPVAAGKTPVEVWVPAFHWLPELTVENTQAVFRDGAWCNLCETRVPWGEREPHVREHRRELREFGRDAERRRRREATERLRLVNRERRLERKVLG